MALSYPANRDTTFWSSLWRDMRATVLCTSPCRIRGCG